MTRVTLAVLAVGLLCPATAPAEYTIPYSVLGCGGGEVGDATHVFLGTLGQVVIGVAGGPSSINEMGFWYQPRWILTGVGDDPPPTRYWLSQNYPNPFNPVTTLRFSVPRRTSVTLRLYNAAGREVRTLVDDELDPGSYTEVVSAQGLSSGVYFCRMVCHGFTETRKLVMLR